MRSMLGLNRRYSGPERRSPSVENVERRSRHAPAEATSLRDQIVAYVGTLPKPLLASISTLALGVAVTTSVSWKNDVDTHVKRAENGYLRLATVEAATARTEHRVDRMEDQLLELRRDQLEASRWDAHRAGDEARVAWLESRLRGLEKRP